uniref:Uncharacterized protein n=1 Tax=Tetraselmis chuii TaxID=63592 RepID=A0A7S1SY48_9CHLO
MLLKALGRSDEADMTSLTSIDEILGASEQQIGAFGDSSQPALASTASRTQLFSQQTSLGRLRASTDSAFPPNTSAAAVAAANGAAGFASAEARVGAASSAFASADARIGVASPLADAIAATEKHGVPPSQALSIDLGFAAAPSVVQQRPMKKASSKDANGFILPTPIKE